MSDIKDAKELARDEIQDAEVRSEVSRWLPDAATVRAALVGVLVFVGAVLGKEGLGSTWVDPFISAYCVVAPLALGWWIKTRHPKPKTSVPAAAAPAPTAVEEAEEYVGKHRAP